jgi:hypothetical protein
MDDVDVIGESYCTSARRRKRERSTALSPLRSFFNLHAGYEVESTCSNRAKIPKVGYGHQREVA